MELSNETIHLNGVHHCERCGLETIKKYRYKGEEIYLCYFCARNYRDSGERLKEID